ncbi:hypothetical protein O181_107380 [Austropuccinia psidii MF-1]|uniref:Uncharacterized protein n=1 Tax=Austropuccinia psidii MF-1 TaxID=1389203 RepID=A0A9Q3PNJ9_9BASI|nr:hypothetical protein [Austropuccinia psidii MF-1]
MLDDLLHHLLTEMAMDGEEGCLVARIGSFIALFYSCRRSHYPYKPAQLIDSSYKKFFWKILCELNQVRLGVLETKSKSNENGEDIIPEVVKDTGLAEFIPPNPDHFKMKVKKLELPFVSTSAENVMNQQPTHMSKSNCRRPSEKPPSLEPSDFAIQKPILSISQVRALETGSVTKDLTASASELTLSKHVRGIPNPPTASATSTWRELSPDLCCLSQDDLISRFGFDEDGESRLKIAVDPMTCWKAVVGTDTQANILFLISVLRWLLIFNNFRGLE